MEITDFKMPTERAWGMLDGFKHAYEKENLLTLILTKNIQSRSFEAVDTEYSHPTMVNDGLLKKVGEKKYKLTEKSKELLYSIYSK